MTASIEILFNTKCALQKLDNDFTDDLSIKTSVIFFLVGIVTGVKSIMTDMKYFSDLNIWATSFVLFISGLMGFLVGKYVISSILFKVGRLLKGKAEFIDIIVVTAYSMIPGFIVDVPILIYKILVPTEYFTNLDYTVINSLYLFSWTLSVKILLQGLKAFNEFGTTKAIVNISPIIVLPAIIYLLSYLIDH